MKLREILKHFKKNVMLPNQVEEIEKQDEPLYEDVHIGDIIILPHTAYYIINSFFNTDKECYTINGFELRCMNAINIAKFIIKYIDPTYTLRKMFASATKVMLKNIRCEDIIFIMNNERDSVLLRIIINDFYSILSNGESIRYSLEKAKYNNVLIKMKVTKNTDNLIVADQFIKSAFTEINAEKCPDIKQNGIIISGETCIYAAKIERYNDEGTISVSGFELDRNDYISSIINQSMQDSRELSVNIPYCLSGSRILHDYIIPLDSIQFYLSDKFKLCDNTIIDLFNELSRVQNVYKYRVQDIDLVNNATNRKIMQIEAFDEGMELLKKALDNKRKFKEEHSLEHFINKDKIKSFLSGIAITNEELLMDKFTVYEFINSKEDLDSFIKVFEFLIGQCEDEVEFSDDKTSCNFQDHLMHY